MSTHLVPFLRTARGRASCARRAVGALLLGVVTTALLAASHSAPPSRRSSTCRRPRSVQPATPRRWAGAAGQATTEYALILLAAALVGLLVVAWATAGGAAGRIGQLFDSVVDSVISRL